MLHTSPYQTSAIFAVLQCARDDERDKIFDFSYLIKTSFHFVDPIATSVHVSVSMEPTVTQHRATGHMGNIIDRDAEQWDHFQLLLLTLVVIVHMCQIQ